MWETFALYSEYICNTKYSYRVFFLQWRWVFHIKNLDIYLLLFLSSPYYVLIEYCVYLNFYGIRANDPTTIIKLGLEAPSYLRVFQLDKS